MSSNFQALVNRLDSQKGPFVEKCRSQVDSYVSNQGADALSLWVGSRLYETTDLKYVAVVSKYAFSDSKRWDGVPIRSILSEPVSKKVAEIYKEFIGEHQAEIEAEFEIALSKSVDFQETISKIIADEVSKRGGKLVRSQISDLVAQALHSSLATQISHSAAASIGTGVGASIIHALVPALTHVLHIAIAKAVGTVVMAKILSIIGAVIMHSIVSVVGVTMAVAFAHAMGGAAASSFLGPVAWVIGGSVVLYKILTLPQKLGSKLGKAVQDQLNGNFSTWTGNAFDKAFEELLDPSKWAKGLVKDMATEGIFDTMDDEFDQPFGVDPDSDYKDGVKIVKKTSKVANKLVKKKW